VNGPLHGKRVLIVDDDSGVVEFLRESLESYGVIAEGTSSSRAALARIEKEAFDLVITDVEMPELRGTELLESILRARSDQLVLLISAFGSIELAVSTVRAGACDFVAKPFKIEALVLSMERAFADRQVRREIVRLRSSIAGHGDGTIVARSPAMSRVVEAARRAARSDSTVLLTGETGTGKSALARLIHDMGARRERPFVQLNCAALPAHLIESELFGVRRGAFTDAKEDRAGTFTAAASGTVFLDEVGELPLEVQAKLLHVLETGKVRPLGGNAELKVDARIIAATNQPLERLLQQGNFRPDLYYRLNVIRLEVPPLRERRDDLVPLVDHFLARLGDRQSRQLVGVSAPAMKKILAYPWPGNVRELANLLERAVAMSEHDILLPEDLDFPPSPGTPPAAPIDATVRSLDEVERAHVRKVLEAHQGNKAAAARALGINRRTLYRKLGE
jgi:DNA-binding NtrC family response regulator